MADLDGFFDGNLLTREDVPEAFGEVRYQVILQVLLAFGFIPSVQAGIVDALCICDKPDVFDFITEAIGLGAAGLYYGLQLSATRSRALG